MYLQKINVLIPNLKHRLKSLFIIGLLVFFGVVLFFQVKSYYELRKLVISSVEKELYKKVVSDADKLDTNLAAIAQQAIIIAEGLSAQTITAIQAQDKLKALMQKNQYILAAGLAYIPYAHDKKIHLYGPSYVKKESSIESVDIGLAYDYTNFDWYTIPLETAPDWVSPFRDPITKKITIRFVVPFFQFDVTNQDRKKIGNVYLDVDHLFFDNFLEELAKEKSLFYFLVNEKHKLITYPITKYTEGLADVFDVSRVSGQQYLRIVGNNLKKEKKGIEYFENASDEKRYIVAHSFLAQAKWYLIAVSSQKEFLLTNSDLRRKLSIVLLFIIIFSFLLCLYLSNLYQKTIIRRWWYLVIFISTLLLITIGFTFYIGLQIYAPAEDRTVISNEIDLENFLRFQQRMDSKYLLPSRAIVPTALLIKTAYFKDYNQVVMSGYIWQKFYKGFSSPKEVRIINAQDQKMSQLYRTTDEDGDETIGWQFNATLIQRFTDFGRYPFDQQEIVMQLENPDFEERIILIPYFKSLISEEISNVMGLDLNLYIAEWAINRSSFFYKTQKYKTNLGFERKNHDSDSIIFSFAIEIRRLFYGTFIAYFLPIIIVAFILFAVMLIVALSERSRSLLATVIGLISGIFFATSIAHQALRKALPTGFAIYFEYFYFLMYIFIILIAANCVIYLLSNKEEGWLYVHNNLIPRLLFWPVLLSFFQAIFFFIFNI